MANRWPTSGRPPSRTSGAGHSFSPRSTATPTSPTRWVRATAAASGATARRLTSPARSSAASPSACTPRSWDQYNWLDYKNDTGKYAPLYGWSEWAVGAQAGYAASKWTDILLAGGYSHYLQKNGHGYHNYNNESEVWTVQAGLGTHATEKITYRVLTGVSWLDYGGHSNADRGWTYSLDANWRITRQLQLSALGKSYYQPSERTRGQAIKVYSLSGGLSYLTLGDKLTLTANVAWRYEDTCYSDRYLA